MKFLNIRTCLYLILSVTVLACSSEHFDKNKKDKGELPISNEWSDTPYKLNVVYFVPQDIDTVEGYEKRISDILLDFQEFTASNMEREGFGRKSFGLAMKNPVKIDITTIEGEGGKEAYPYSGGGGTIINELDDYFNEYPDEKYSEHTLVIVPSTSGDPMNPGGVPFYGLGKYCFALDYEEMKAKHLGEPGELGDLATKWIGGMLHELGHGLNAPHNKEKKSEQETLGTALMGSGNYSYGKSDTFITGATAATFANSQVFSSEVRPDWYTSVDHEITKLRGKFENDKIKISGNFESDYEVTDIVVWHDPYPAGGNQDYDAPAWNAKPVSQDSLHIEMELSEFYKTEGDYQLRIRFYHQNGTQKTYSYEYEFQDEIPNIEVINTRDLLNREQWSIVEVSSEEDTGAASNMLNGNLESVWHTEWKNSLPNHPHHFILDMGETVTIDGLAFANRSNLNGSIKDFHLSASNNNEEWDDLGNYTLDQVQNWQYIDVPENTSYRYYRLETQNSYGGFNYAHLAELAAY